MLYEPILHAASSFPSVVTIKELFPVVENFTPPFFKSDSFILQLLLLFVTVIDVEPPIVILSATTLTIMLFTCFTPLFSIV